MKDIKVGGKVWVSGGSIDPPKRMKVVDVCGTCVVVRFNRKNWEVDFSEIKPKKEIFQEYADACFKESQKYYDLAHEWKKKGEIALHGVAVDVPLHWHYDPLT